MGLTNRKRKVYKHFYYQSTKGKVLQTRKSNAGKGSIYGVKKNRAGFLLHNKNYARNSNVKKRQREYGMPLNLSVRAVKRERYASQPERKRQVERGRSATPLSRSLRGK